MAREVVVEQCRARPIVRTNLVLRRRTRESDDVKRWAFGVSLYGMRAHRAPTESPVEIAITRAYCGEIRCAGDKFGVRRAGDRAPPSGDAARGRRAREIDARDADADAPSRSRARDTARENFTRTLARARRRARRRGRRARPHSRARARRIATRRAAIVATRATSSEGSRDRTRAAVGRRRGDGRSIGRISRRRRSARSRGGLDRIGLRWIALDCV